MKITEKMKNLKEIEGAGKKTRIAGGEIAERWRGERGKGKSHHISSPKHVKYKKNVIFSFLFFCAKCFGESASELDALFRREGGSEGGWQGWKGRRQGGREQGQEGRR